MRHVMSVVLALAVVACGSSDSREQFHANMDAAQEVPPPTNISGANPTGTAAFTNNNDGTVSYTVNASGLTTQFSGVTFTGMHIHLAATGVQAGIAVPLTTPTPGSTAGTTTVTGTFSASNVSAPNTFDSVLTAMRTGGAYINIHTSRNMSGEIRGQILTGP
jgi:hypothetical protein